MWFCSALRFGDEARFGCRSLRPSRACSWFRRRRCCCCCYCCAPPCHSLGPPSAHGLPSGRSLFFVPYSPVSYSILPGTCPSEPGECARLGALRACDTIGACCCCRTCASDREAPLHCGHTENRWSQIATRQSALHLDARPKPRPVMYTCISAFSVPYINIAARTSPSNTMYLAPSLRCQTTCCAVQTPHGICSPRTTLPHE